MRYRLRTSINTLHATNRALQIVTVPRDSVVELCGDDHCPDMVNVRFKDLVVAAWLGDLRAHGERLMPLAG